MGVMDRLRGRKSALARALGPARTRGEVDELVDIAGRTTSSGELTHFFVASSDARLIEAYYDLLRVGAPAYGGAASRFRAGHSTLELREQHARQAHIRFVGESTCNGRIDRLEDMTDALTALRSGGGSDEAQVAHIAVGPRGADWVREVNTTVMGAAVGQMSPLFRMISTTDEAAARYLCDSLRDETAPSSPPVGARLRVARRGRTAPALGTT